MSPQVGTNRETEPAPCLLIGAVLLEDLLKNAACFGFLTSLESANADVQKIVFCHPSAPEKNSPKERKRTTFTADSFW
jgi:hypothetical protein